MKYTCTFCEYSTNRKSNYEAHNKSQKHLKNVSIISKINLEPHSKNTNNVTLNEQICYFCKQKFKNLFSLKRHQSTCTEVLKENYKLKRDNENLLEKVERLEDELLYFKDLLEVNADSLNKSVSANYVKEANKFLSQALIFDAISEDDMKIFMHPKQLEDDDKVVNIEIKDKKKHSWYLYDCLVNEYNKGRDKRNNNVNQTKCRTMLAKHFAEGIYHIYGSEEPKEQPIWTTDITRYNFIINEVIKNTKKSRWKSDKNGEMIRQKAINPLLDHVKEQLEIEMNNDRKYIKKNNKNLSAHKMLQFTDRIRMASYIIRDIENGSLGTEIIKRIAPMFKLDKSCFIELKEDHDLRKSRRPKKALIKNKITTKKYKQIEDDIN